MRRGLVCRRVWEEVGDRTNAIGRASATVVVGGAIAVDYKLLALRQAWNGWSETSQEYLEARAALHAKSADVRGLLPWPWLSLVRCRW